MPKHKKFISEKDFEEVLDSLLQSATEFGRALRTAERMANPEPVPDVSHLLREELRASLLEHFEIHTLERHLEGWAPGHLSNHLAFDHNVSATYGDGLEAMNKWHREAHEAMGGHHED